MFIDEIPLGDLLALNINGAVQQKSYLPTIAEIPISRVIYSGNKTIVWFIDGTKCVVNCSANDNYDRKTAIVYALVKRIFGKVGRFNEKTMKFIENEIDGNGIGTKLDKIAASGFDQDMEKANLEAKKAQAKADHIARQKKESDAAFERKARKLAEKLRLKKRAEEILKEDTTLNKTKKVINESKDSSTFMTAEDFFGEDVDDKKSEIGMKPSVNESWQSYKRPNKPFSKFTHEEKKEYWSYYNHKRRSSKK